MSTAHPPDRTLRRYRVLGLLAAFLSLPTSAAVDEVIVVFKTHFDIGYTDLASNVVQRYRTTMIDDALKVVDRNRDLPADQQFAWTLPGWPLTQIIADWPGQDSERQRRVQEALRSGRFVFHALPFTTHTEWLEPEDLVRGLGFSSRLSRIASLELPRDAKMTDVPCHSWILPTLLRHAGVEFLHLGCNAASRSPEVPVLFWWEGPDGSRLLTMYTAESYGTGLQPPVGWPHRAWLALIHTGDNHGPPTPEEVAKLRSDAAASLPGVKLRIGRLSDFSEAILASKPDLPVVRGDMPDTWIHGPMCDPAGARQARQVRGRLAAAEALNTELRLWMADLPSASLDVAAAREQSLLYGEHTWGGALYWVSKYSAGTRLPHGDEWRRLRDAGKFDRLESSWAEHSAYIERCASITDPLLRRELETLARSVNTSGPRTVVFNPLPWPRAGVVSTPGNGARFVADTVPALGYRTYPGDHPPAPPRSSEPKAAGTILQNRHFRLEFDPRRAAVVSLVDRRSRRELVDATSTFGFGQFVLERFSENEVAAFVKAYVKIDADWATNELGKPNLAPAAKAPYRALVPRDARLRFERDDVSASAVLESTADGPLPAVTTRWSLPTHGRHVDLEVTVHDKPADPWPEACWIALPFRVESPRFRLGRLGSIIDPTTDIVPGANRHLAAVQTGVALFDPAGAGVGVCPLDSPLVSLDSPGCWKFSRDFVPRRPAVFVNLYNNQWTTNFRLWNGGTWTWRVRLWSFDRYEPAAGLITPSLEALNPLIATVDGGAGVPGSLPTHRRGLSVDRAGVMATAFGDDPDGEGWRLRLWELAGESGPCQVRLPEGCRATFAQPIDLRGQGTGAAIPIRSGRFEAMVGRFAPASFRLVFR